MKKILSLLLFVLSLNALAQPVSSLHEITVDSTPFFMFRIDSPRVVGAVNVKVMTWENFKRNYLPVTSLIPGTGIGILKSGSSYTITGIATPTITLAGDVTGTSTNTITTTLANSGVSAGTYSLSTITVDAKGRVTSASNGTVSMPASGWSLTGNAGTHDTTNFIGTTDHIPLTFMVDNTQAGRIDFVNSYFGLGAGIGSNAASALGNTAMGWHSLLYDPGNYNTSVGYSAMEFSNNSTRNTALGANALNQNHNGSRNTSVGYLTLPQNFNGNDNTSVGYSSSYSNTYGNFNTSLGSNAFYSNTTGNYNTSIGSFSDVTIATLFNANSIGAYSQVGQSNSLVLGGVDVSTVSYYSLSGTYAIGETVTGGTSGATGVVISNGGDGGELGLHSCTGIFQLSETITGGTSGATSTSFAVINGTNVGIGIPTPQAKLHIVGDMIYKYMGNSPSVGDVLTAIDTNGAVRWKGTTNVTYDSLKSHYYNKTLTKGYYRITDYRTRHFIVDQNQDQYLSDTIMGDLEELIIRATSDSTIDKVALSVNYPQDIIYYDVDSANWNYDLSFSDGSTHKMINNYKGTIYFRHDTRLDNYMSYDFRNCKFRRWAIDTTTLMYNAGTTYAAGEIVYKRGFVYKSLISGNVGNTPADGAIWIKLIDLSITAYWCNRPGMTNGITAKSTDHVDFKTFAETLGSSTYDKSVRSNHFKGFKDDSYQYEVTGTLLQNNVFFLNNSSYFSVYLNDFGSGAMCNTFAGSVRDNSIDELLTNNIIGTSFQSNDIGVAFNSNVLSDLFYNNTVNQGCLLSFIGSNCNTNIIKNTFQYNIIGSGCIDNDFGTKFSTNIIKNNFQQNSISANIASTDFTTATLVYLPYSKRITVRPDGAYRLIYTNNSDAQVIVPATN